MLGGDLCSKRRMLLIMFLINTNILENRKLAMLLL